MDEVLSNGTELARVLIRKKDFEIPESVIEMHKNTWSGKNEGFSVMIKVRLRGGKKFSIFFLFFKGEHVSEDSEQLFFIEQKFFSRCNHNFAPFLHLNIFGHFLKKFLDVPHAERNFFNFLSTSNSR